MHIGKKNNRHNYSMIIDNTNHQLRAVTEEKDLGVTIDEMLKFQAQHTSVVNRGHRMTGVIKRSFEHLDKKTFNLLYKALVRPILEYTIPAYSPYQKKDMDSYEKVQRRATKLVPTLKDSSYQQRMLQLKLPSLSYRRSRGDMITVYNCLHGNYRINSERLIPQNH
ncbi:uncharacterized protein LOC141911524 [Tubulanus polymorphus]|uniref:uncharacterized protein LOC141911524 n=1 Tax=Tubulanus polymorphus TaxID=672921 RepID=UPI003DA21FC7